MPGIDACLKEAMSLPGARGAAIVDWTSGLALGTAGESPNGDHEATAAETAELARAAAEYTAFAPVATARATATAATAVTAVTAAAAARATESAKAQRSAGDDTGGTGGTGPAGAPSTAGITRTSGTSGTSGTSAASATSATSATDSTSRDKSPPVEDLIVTTRTGYHILSFVETTFDSSVFLHLWLDRDTGNLALARLRLGQLAERLVLG